eukprot:255629_1
MNVFNPLSSLFASNKRKKQSLPPLQGVKQPKLSKKNPLDPSEESFGHEHKQEYKKGEFTVNNLHIKDFTDNEIKKCFDSFDLDGNGFLCAAEIMRCFEQLGEKVTDQEIDEMIKMCDENGDGQIEFEEFQVMVYREAGIHKKPGSNIPGATFGRMATKFSIADVSVLQQQRNRKERLKVLFEILDFETKSMKDIHANFLLMDDMDERALGLVDFADFCACTKIKVCDESKELFSLFQHESVGDKYIDYRYFLISLVSMLSPSLEMKIKFTFDVFDIDGNGLIDREELTAVVSATQLLRGKQLIERVDKIMHLADSDGNEELDYNEFAVCCRRYQSLLFPRL